MRSALFLAALSLCAAGPVLAGGRTTAELTFLLRHDCGSCHGMTMKGGLGSPLLPERLAGVPDEALVAVILDGIPGTPMPPWRGLITPEEARRLVARLRRGGFDD